MIVKYWPKLLFKTNGFIGILIFTWIQDLLRWKGNWRSLYSFSMAVQGCSSEMQFVAVVGGFPIDLPEPLETHCFLYSALRNLQLRQFAVW